MNHSGGKIIWLLFLICLLVPSLSFAKIKPINLKELRFDYVLTVSHDKEGDWVQATLVNGKNLMIYDQEHRFRSALIRDNEQAQILLGLILNLSLTGLDYVGQAPSEAKLASMISVLIPRHVSIKNEVDLVKARKLAIWLASLAKEKKLGTSEVFAVSQ